MITTLVTFFTTAQAMNMVGAKRGFVELDWQTFNIHRNLMVSTITDRTKVVLPVPLCDGAAAMDLILALICCYDLKVVEDSAQAFRGEYKAHKLGDGGAFSVFPQQPGRPWKISSLLIDSSVKLEVQEFATQALRGAITER